MQRSAIFRKYFKITNREVFLKPLPECKSIDVKDFFRGKELTLYDLIFYDVSKK